MNQQQPEGTEGNSTVPQIILQRQSSDLPDHNHSPAKVQRTSLDSIGETGTHSMPDAIISRIQSPQDPPLDSSPSSGFADHPHPNTHPSRPPPLETLPDPISIPMESFEPTSPVHRSTDPISTATTNSRVRMVDNHPRWKKNRIKSFEDITHIPGSEILIFNGSSRKWEVKQKSEFKMMECKKYVTPNSTINVNV
jgi:hypothetical protein